MGVSVSNRINGIGYTLLHHCLKDMKDIGYVICSYRGSRANRVSCTGIIIGGGVTELYHKYIVETELSIHIKKMYEQGIPVAGFSAGALISPKNCVIPPIDNASGKHLFLTGLGLIKDCVISVHFSKWNEEENLKTALSKVEASIGYGIDDKEGLYFKNEGLSETEGEKFYIFKSGRSY